MCVGSNTVSESCRAVKFAFTTIWLLSNMHNSTHRAQLIQTQFHETKTKPIEKHLNDQRNKFLPRKKET